MALSMLRTQTPSTAPGPRFSDRVEVFAAWFLGLAWIAPLVYIFWAAFRVPREAISLNPFQGWTLENLTTVWQAAPFDLYYRNTIMLVTGLTIGQIVLGVLAAYVFARYSFRGSSVLFGFVL